MRPSLARAAAPCWPSYLASNGVSRIGELLQRYKSGKIPKPVKILPTVPQWEGLLEYLQPDLWTANALYEVTKVFSSAKPAASQRWLELVILDSVRDDIRETKRLSVHLFNALKRRSVTSPHPAG